MGGAVGSVPGGPTLPPHPKQKQLQTQGLPGSMALPPARMNSLRGISALSRGISSFSRGLSTESQGGINAFEDKFFSMLMNNESNKQIVGSNVPGNFNPTPMSASNMGVGLNSANNINSNAINSRSRMDNNRSNSNKGPILSRRGGT